ncbi:unnamed protein product [Rotaria sp. Silwood1]|nr:unnamed protein product [Rotaria sp. Silwood1]
MHSLYKPSLESRVFTVYRGLNMPLEDFEKTIRGEIKNLIAFDSFLSTSLDENVAKQFALDKQDSKNESVVFCMEIDADRMERPFADISRWSDFKNEREVLFSIGTVFRIDDVADKKTSDGIWMVRLLTVSEKDEQLQKETQQIQITLLRFFEDVLHAQREAKDYRKIPASNANVAKSPDPLTKATYITNVAKTQMALGYDDKALVLYKEALDIRRHLCQPNDPSLVQTLHTIGHIYRGEENWNEAFAQYNQALKLQLLSIESRILSDPSSIAVTIVFKSAPTAARAFAETTSCFSIPV